MSGPNFNKNSGRGRLATDRYDYQKHIDGQADKHKDSDIAISPAIPSLPSAATVHDALTTLGSSLSASDSFISIGKGYDVWAGGVYNAATPYLDVALNDLLNNVNNTQRARLLDGGVIVIRAGTYKIGQTVNIPAGITLMGEGFGTKLVNATVAYGGFQAPMFRIVADTNRYEDMAIAGADTAYNPFLNSKNTTFMNLVVSDNYLKPATLGDTSYKVAVNTTQPLVEMERGAGFVCQGVTFVGRSALSVPGNTSLSAIATSISSATSFSTELMIHDCDFDGFNQTIKYLPTHGTLDSLTFRGNRVRNFGPVSNTNTAVNSNVIFTNACNVNVTDNYIWTNRDLLACVYVDAVTTDTITTQGRAKITVTNNVVASNKPSNSSVTFTPVSFNVAIASPANSVVSVSYGNIIDQTEGFKVKVNPTGNQILDLNASASTLGLSTSNLTISANALATSSATTTTMTSAGALTLSAPVVVQNSSLSQKIATVTTTYTVVDPNSILLLNSSGGSFTVTLPAVTNQRTLVLKDTGSASSYNITVIPNASDSTIDGLSSVVMASNWMSITLVSNGTAWFIL